MTEESYNKKLNNIVKRVPAPFRNLVIDMANDEVEDGGQISPHMAGLCVANHLVDGISNALIEYNKK